MVLSANVRSCDSCAGRTGVRTAGRAVILNALKAARRPNDGGIADLCSTVAEVIPVDELTQQATWSRIRGCIENCQRPNFCRIGKLHVTPRHADTARGPHSER